MTEQLRACRWIVQGRVQGVGFRWHVLSLAQGLGARGWVANRDDGAVEVVGLATEATIARLDTILRKGPPGSRVTSVTQEDVPHEHVDAKSFTIKR